MFRSTLTVTAAAAAMFAVGQTPVEAGDRSGNRSGLSVQLSLGNGYGSGYRGGYGNGLSGYSSRGLSNYGRSGLYGGNRFSNYGYGSTFDRQSTFGPRFNGYSSGCGNSYRRGNFGYSGYGNGYYDDRALQIRPYGHPFGVTRGRYDFR